MGSTGNDITEESRDGAQTESSDWANAFRKWLAGRNPTSMSTEAILLLDKTAKDVIGHPWTDGMEELRARGGCSQEYVTFFYNMEDNSAFVTYAKVPQVIRGMFNTEHGIESLDTNPETLRRMLMEVTISRDVETFLYYLTQKLLSIFTQRPEALVGFLEDDDKKVDVRDVLQCQDRSEFVKLVAGRLVDALGYRGLPEIVRRLNQRMKLGYNTDNADFRDAQEIIEVRNIIAHNASRVSRPYLQRTRRTDLKEGDLYPLTVDYVVDAGYKLISVAGGLERLFNSKFHVSA